MSAPRHVACPTCGRPVALVAANRYRPFCSRRCRLVDFGGWVTEERRIPGEAPAGEDPAPQGDAPAGGPGPRTGRTRH